MVVDLCYTLCVDIPGFWLQKFMLFIKNVNNLNFPSVETKAPAGCTLTSQCHKPLVNHRSFTSKFCQNAMSSTAFFLPTMLRFCIPLPMQLIRERRRFVFFVILTEHHEQLFPAGRPVINGVSAASQRTSPAFQADSPTQRGTAPHVL